jgi:glycosyltransferase involved in cell wall biosynthesis
MKLSVVICVRNEGQRLRDCLESVIDNLPDEIILVDGNSSDNTLEIAREFSNIKIIESKHSSLTRDRQLGLDAAKNDLIAMIDADHRLAPDDLKNLLDDMSEFNLDLVTARLISYQNHGFWDAAEEASWLLTQDTPGVKNMVGTAPAIYKKRIFKFVRFDDHVTKSIDDTDFCYRLSKIPEIRMGIGRTRIRQYHFADLGTYLRKFLWYGKGDGEFCRKNPERMPSMFFHLLIRYPFIYPFKAIRAARFNAIPFFVLQGSVRFIGLAKYFIFPKLWR